MSNQKKKEGGRVLNDWGIGGGDEKKKTYLKDG